MIFRLKKTTTVCGYVQRLVGDKIIYYVSINIVSKLTFITLSYEIRSQNYKTQENSNFLKNDKIVILIKTRNFSRSRMTKRTSPL